MRGVFLFIYIVGFLIHLAIFDEWLKRTPEFDKTRLQAAMRGVASLFGTVLWPLVDIWLIMSRDK